MEKNRFRLVNCMADDAITVRLRRDGKRCIGILDFPTFQASTGRIIRSDFLPPFPAAVALLKATQIQPLTPYREIVVRLEDGVEWMDFGEIL
jgi:hypothetical protein